MPELVEILGPDGTIVGVVGRPSMRRNRLRHRAAFVAVVDRSNRLLVHRRSDDKDVWPGRWDIAAGGVCNVGEAWQAAAERELLEELGLCVPLEHLAVGTFADDAVDVVGVAFLARSDGPVHFGDGEVVEARWVDAAELTALRATEVFCPDSIAIVLPALIEGGLPA